MGLTDLFREGAVDLLGGSPTSSDEVEALRESAQAGQMLARRIEDLSFGNLLQGETASYFDPERSTQHGQTLRAYKYFFNDPVVKRTVMLRALYTFGRGMTPPKYRPDPNAPEAQGRAGQAYIDRFWSDPENQQALTGATAMFQKDIESSLQGNVFLLLFRGSERSAMFDPDLIQAEGAATLKLSDIPEREIVDVISHPGNRKLPVYYKRQYRTRRYDFGAQQGEGSWDVGDLTTVYYRDWRNEAPSEWGVDRNGMPCDPTSPQCTEVKPWGPADDAIGDGVVYHVFENKTSDMRFGINDAQAYMKWAKGLNEYMTARMSMVQALAQLAMRAKTKGGPKNVSQVASALSDLTKLAGAVEGTESLKRLPGVTGRTLASVESNGVDLQPMVQDTNAQNAQGDIQVMKGQVAAGSGIPVHHLGDVGSANLAQATSMDGPLLRLIQWNQERWKMVHRDLTGYMLEGVGLDPRRLEVDMPPILERDVGNVAAYLSSAAGVIDPNGASNPLHRFILGEILDSMGKQNGQELVDKIIPENAETPFDQALRLAQMGAAPGVDADGEALAGFDDQTTKVQRGAMAVQQAATAAELAANQGRQRGPNADGGPMAASRTSRDRAARRYELAQETLPGFDGASTNNAFDRLIEGEFPDELVQAAAQALAVFDND